MGYGGVPGSGYIRTKTKSHANCTPAAPRSGKVGRETAAFSDGPGRPVLDNYDNSTYADGFAGSMYGVSPGLANALRLPGEFQTYDIVFRHPIYKNGKPIDPGYVTVFENGVLVLDHAMIEGETGHMRRSKPQAFPDAGSLKLQDHSPFVIAIFGTDHCQRGLPRAALTVF
jgi:hypothetical protein